MATLLTEIENSIRLFMAEKGNAPEMILCSEKTYEKIIYEANDFLGDTKLKNNGKPVLYRNIPVFSSKQYTSENSIKVY